MFGETHVQILKEALRLCQWFKTRTGSEVMDQMRHQLLRITRQLVHRSKHIDLPAMVSFVCLIGYATAEVGSASIWKNLQQTCWDRQVLRFELLAKSKNSRAVVFYTSLPTAA